MIKIIDDALQSFKKCFSRAAAFKWFVVIIIGMMLRTEKLGVTTIIRTLGLESRYEPLIKYFRSSAWDLNSLERNWMKYVANNTRLVEHDGAAILVGDGIKVSKEGKRMPAVKRLYQESENSSKPAHITGQMYGCVGVLAEGGGKTYCIPLACELQDGAKEILSWGEEPYGYRQGTHTVELVSLAHRTTETLPNAILLLDRYYLSIPALERIDAFNVKGGGLRAIFMAKSSVVAYELPDGRNAGQKGRPRIKGKAIKLSGLFDVEADMFRHAKIPIYGKETLLRYMAKDLLWGKGFYRQMRFVLVEINGRRVIIASTDTKIEPLDIIKLYAKRFTIECTFKSMKNDVAAFSNRFWSKHLPKLNRYAKTGGDDRLKKVKTEHERRCVRQALDATEGYVFCSVVAVGLLQILSLIHFRHKGTNKLRYLRTPSKTVASEATVSEYLRRSFYYLLVNTPNIAISHIIQSKICKDSIDLYDFKAG